MILVVDMNWKRDSLSYFEFIQPIITLIEPLSTCKVKHYLDLANQDLNGCSKIILSGTSLKDNFFLDKIEKFAWLKKIQIPLLGICAGMEVIGKVFGCNLLPCTEIGMTQIRTETENPLFRGDFNAYSLHSYCVYASDEFTVLATSPNCDQAIKHKRKEIYGTLFHPEVRNPEIIKNFVDLH